MMLVVLAHEDPRRQPKALFAMTTRDAAVLCSDPRSIVGNWTAVFAPYEDWSTGGKVAKGSKYPDPGVFDELVKDLGLKKYSI